MRVNRLSPDCHKVESVNERPSLDCLPAIGGTTTHCAITVTPMPPPTGSVGMGRPTEAFPEPSIMRENEWKNGIVYSSQVPQSTAGQSASSASSSRPVLLGYAPSMVIPKFGFGEVLNEPLKPISGGLPT